MVIAVGPPTKKKILSALLPKKGKKGGKKKIFKEKYVKRVVKEGERIRNRKKKDGRGGARVPTPTSCVLPFAIM